MGLTLKGYRSFGQIRNWASFLKIPCFGKIENALEAYRASPRRICVGFPPDPFEHLTTTPQVMRVCVVHCCFFLGFLEWTITGELCLPGF